MYLFAVNSPTFFNLNFPSCAPSLVSIRRLSAQVNNEDHLNNITGLPVVHLVQRAPPLLHITPLPHSLLPFPSHFSCVSNKGIKLEKIIVIIKKTISLTSTTPPPSKIQCLFFVIVAHFTAVPTIYNLHYYSSSKEALFVHDNQPYRGN